MYKISIEMVVRFRVWKGIIFVKKIYVEVMISMNIPPLGTPLPVQILDNDLPGHAITQLSTTVNDIATLQAYLQSSLSNFTQLFYYPQQAVLQIQTLGNTADTDAIHALMNAYSNPQPFISSSKVIDITPLSVSSDTWKTVFVLNSTSSDNKRLIQATISSSMTSANSGSLSYSVRFVAVDVNQVLGSVSANNTVYQTQVVTFANVPAGAFSLEVQIETAGGAFANVRSMSLTYQQL